MVDVFVSYKAEDRTRIAPLVQALETDGLSVWWDAHIAGGDAWREAILRNLESAKCVLVIWSRRSVGPKGEFVRDEASHALRRRAYCPIRIDKVEPPLGFGETQALDLTGWKGDRSDPRYQAVLDGFRERFGIKPKRLPPATPERRVLSRRTAVIGATGTVVCAAGIGTWIALRPSTAHAESIAVLPFENLSGDPKQTYFSDGIAEELRGTLSRIAGVSVIGRTSSEAVRNEDAQSAAKKLGVANILTGSVRESSSTIRVSAELVDGKNGVERWSETYDRSPGDAIKIQTDIAESVAKALSATLSGGRTYVAGGGTQNANAQKLMLQAAAAAHEHTTEGLQAALSLADGAIALDPNYAEAYVLKARVLNRYGNTLAKGEDVPRYRQAALGNARKALQIAPNLSSAHNALGAFLSHNLQLRAADLEYKRALFLAPGNADTIRDYAQFASLVGRSQEALSLSHEAIRLDPLNTDSFYTRFFVLTNNRQFEDAVRLERQVQRPTADWIYYLAICLIALGRTDEARQAISPLAAESSDRLTIEAILSGRAGTRIEARRTIEKLKAIWGDFYYQYAEIYAQAGDRGRAFEALDRAWQIRDSGLLWLKVDPLLDPLRREPRFQALMTKLDFPT